MNNEPVAWMDEDENVVFEKCKVYPIPLYIHPVKELTDEEILSVFVENYGDDILPNIQASGIGFARAILKKASEK